ncbi:MAG: general secretion pathway protein GspL [Nitrosomonadales bacterium]|nr:general secretion pathway protein GspL [Nitrosomonadales bacterium]
MSTLYIRLLSKATADSAPNWLALVCPYALVSNNGIGRQGMSALPGLADTIANTQRVVLLLAASDVTLLRAQVPPLSPAKLKAALPNLVEDQLISDPSDCQVVASGLSDGLRTVAVVQRAWLDKLAQTLTAFGARHISALPAQLCLPYQAGSAIAAFNSTDSGADIDMTLRLSEQDGLGLAISAEPNEPAEHAVIRALCAMAPAEKPITLYVPQSALPACQAAISDIGNPRIKVSADNWSHWIAGANSTTLDLMAGLGLRSGAKLDWRPWRWPLALAFAVLLVNAAALNIDWWRMKSEASALRATMTQIYKSAYPKESVIIDPIAQMQQKIAIAKRDSGLAAPDDFTAITATFSEVWSGVIAATGKPAPPIAALEYRERSLVVRIKANGGTLTQAMNTALAQRDLTLDPVSESSDATIWKIRSAK